MSVTAASVKELREKTGAGMMDCKKALLESGGDMESSVDWLRKKGLSAASKKSGRVVAEGLVGLCVTGTDGFMVEVNSETDFVARNETFQEFLMDLVQSINFSMKTVEDLMSSVCRKTKKPIQELLTELIVTVGENIQIRRFEGVQVKKGCVASYVHGGGGNSFGKLGVLVGLESACPQETLLQIGKKLAMHIAAARPCFLKIEEVSADILAREKSIFTEQALALGKTGNIVEKMVEGRIRKYYEEAVLLEQIFMIEGENMKVRDFISACEKEQGMKITLEAFALYAVGEGIEKKEVNFSEEVAATLKK